ncbi:PREDICTED: coiled-coil domain-containing protein 94 [Nicrophorus vespilloides]|uniref:Splicing factor YJU2 n=1 Tax=Nicrophorus vespilloides TaxID=110193 RepID=A0ABM1M5K8_NICVS|nr:PREDICTED: coiled-coil domain-containing protein 94 [Nicrophorus vespilloides]
MSERKVLNKYYPPDFDPAKIPRMKLPKNRQYTVRLMAPFNMRCATCGEYIYKGKKFNARKEDVEHQDYLGIRIYRFYIKCTRCLQEISFKTDPRNTDYEIEAGATRNFMALKLAEELAQREEEELKEEEASNPMKLLENRTKQSKNEIELLESLEELKDLNKRQQAVDFDGMLSVYDTKMTEREREEKLKQMDEDYIKTVKFQSGGGSKRKVVVEEEIIEDVVDPKITKINEACNVNTTATTSSSGGSSKISANTWTNSTSVGGGALKGKKLSGLVKLKRDCAKVTSAQVSSAPATTTSNSLSLLGAYSDSSESNSD